MDRKRMAGVQTWSAYFLFHCIDKQYPCEYAVYYYVGICFRRFKLCMDCAGGL
jgi:hypothetical protein